MTWRSRLMCLVVLGCGRWAPPSAPTGLLVSGCEHRLAGDVCVTAGEITVWLPATVTAEVRGGQLLGVDEVEGGRRARLKLEDGEEVAVDGWRLVARTSEVDCADGVPRREGEEGMCLTAVARAAFAEGRHDDAMRLHGEAKARYAAAGWERERVMTELRVAFAEVELGLVGAVPRVEEGTDDLVLAYMAAYVVGIRASLVGDVGAAARAFTDAISLAERGNSAGRVAQTREVWAAMLVRLGRFDEALAQYEATQTAPGASACTVVDRGVARAWGWTGALEGASAGLRQGLDPWPLLEGALAAADACPGRGREADIRVNRARALWVRGAAAEALSELELAAGLEMNADTARWWRELKGRAHLAVRDPVAARTAWSEALAHTDGDLELEWMAHVGLARAQVALGDDEGGLSHFETALAVAEEHAVMVPLWIGRATFVDQRTRVSGDHVTALVRLGRAAEAFGVARAWRAQILRSLAAGERMGGLQDTGRTDWDDAVGAYRRARLERARLMKVRATAPADEVSALDTTLGALRRQEREALDTGAVLLGLEVAPLRDPLPGELLVVWTQVDAREGAGWRALARDRVGVTVGPPVAIMDPTALLAPLAKEIRRAERVTFLAPGALEGLDLHRGVIDGVPLIRSHEVSWSVDVRVDLEDTPEGLRALVVADPGGGLAAARAEGEEVAGLLEAAGWTVARLGAGTRDLDLLAALDGSVGLFHYAGHGEARAEGLGARLVLGGGSALGVPDVLTLRRAPRWVVLAGCETGRTLPLGIAEIGLAHAFVVVGSEGVVATARRVDDRLALALSGAFYRADPQRVGVGTAFAAAVRAVAAQDPESDWAAFRLVVP